LARTRSHDYDNIQASILDTTAGLFASRGYAATSIGDIAEACACSKSRLYHYFESKEAILANMLEEHVEMLVEGSTESMEGVDDPVVKFRRLIAFYMEVYAISREKHIVLLTCMDFLPDNIRKDVVLKERRLVSFVQDILVEICPEGAESKDLAHIDTMLFFGMINWTYTWFRANGAMKPEQLADRCVSLFLDGYRGLHKAAPQD
jgi:AcrR family transcriptional regulator